MVFVGEEELLKEGEFEELIEVKSTICCLSYLKTHFMLSNLIIYLPTIQVPRSLRIFVNLFTWHYFIDIDFFQE